MAFIAEVSTCRKTFPKIATTTCQKTLLSESSKFVKTNLLIFRNKEDNRLLFVNESDLERSRFRLIRRIRQNEDDMKEDFKTFITFTYDDQHLFDASASKNISKFLNEMHYALIKLKAIDKFNELKYLYKVEWGSHNFTARMHIHLLCNIPYSVFSKCFEKGKRPWFTEMWGRGIVQVKEITQYYSRKKNKTYSKEESCLYYLFKYFKKDYSKDIDCKHQNMHGNTARRWGTSQHYKTQTNKLYECLRTEKIDSEEHKLEIYHSMFEDWVNQSIVYDYDSKIYQWTIGDRIICTAPTVKVLYEVMEEFQNMEFFRMCLARYPKENSYDDLSYDKNYGCFDNDFKEKKKEMKKRIKSRQAFARILKASPRTLTPIEYSSTDFSKIALHRLLSANFHGRNLRVLCSSFR